MTDFDALSTTGPLVSIVVPMYNVEVFLEQCLRSILSQSYEAIELIVVDDGATDGSFAVARRVLNDVETAQIIRQDNAGLGAARNAGAAAASGEFLMFVDSDDVVPPTAVARLVSSLLQTDSDFATGRVNRFDSRREWRSAVSKSPFNVYRPATSLAELPLLVYDTVACNKLFRRDFFDRSIGEFPEGVLYEDIYKVYSAYAAASSVDVLPDVVYLWRERDAGASSITQSRRGTSNLADRAVALMDARKVLAAHGDPHVLKAFDDKITGFDFILYVERATDPQDEFTTAILEHFGPLADSVDTSPDDYTTRGVLEALRRRDGRAVCAYGAIKRGEGGPATVAAALLAAGTPSAAGRVASETGVLATRRVLRRLKLGGTKPTRARVGPVDIGRGLGKVGAGISRLGLGKPGVTFNTSSRHIPSTSRRLWTGYGESGLITMRLQRTDLLAAIEDEATDHVTIAFTQHGDRARVFARGLAFGQIIEFDGADRTWRAHLAEFDRAPDRRFGIFRVDSNGHEARVLAPKDMRRAVIPHGSYEVVSARMNGLELGLTVRAALRLANVDYNLRTKVLSVVVPESLGATRARLYHPALSTPVDVPQADGGVFEIRFGRIEKYGDRIPLRVGKWRFEVMVDGRWASVGCSESLSTSVDDPDAGLKYDIACRDTSLTIRSAMLPRARGNWAMTQQRRANELPELAWKRPMERAIVYECYFGRQVSCHPRALIEPMRERLPGVKEYWVLNSAGTYAPEGMTPIVRWTAEWYDVSASSAILVTNCGLAPYFRRREGQVVLQAWHGTPLKRIGLDMLTFEHFRPEYRDEQVVQANQWTHLISPSDFCSDIFPRAFSFDRPMIEVGSPRNDVLVNGLPDDELEQLRTRVGIEPGQRAVLYAPTWRDDEKRDGGFFATSPVNLDALAASLGPDVVVLFRAHSNIASLSTGSSSGAVINVSDYPDIADLYLVADVLVTDYSSVMFDYAVTSKPMVFHCPDLEQYRDELRGWYFDLEAEAPGPITRNAAQLSRAIRAGLEGRVRAEHLTRYTTFRDKYCAWEHGDASERVADEVVGSIDWSLVADAAHVSS